jgi:peroxiredoxin
MIAALVLIVSIASAQGATVGQKIQDFRLQDFRGGWHQLETINQKVVVVAFLGYECPLVKVYAPRLVALNQEYSSKDVAFLAINPNSQDSVTEMASFARRHEMNFPFLKDVGNVVADAFQVERTPEIFVLDENRVVRFHGRVDDQYGVGYIRPQVTKHFLKDAIEEVLAGKEVTLAETPCPGCLIGRTRKAKTNSEVTYSNQIARIFQKRCEECHREGQIGPFALSNYEEVAGWADMIGEVVDQQRMPPWHANPAHGVFSNAAQMPDEEKQLIADWVAAGAPEGDPKDLPEPRQFAEGWRIPTPDLVLEMSEEHELPAEGEIPYQYYVLDPKLTDDKWVVATECVPGNPAVVHHIIAFVVPPELAKDLPVGRFAAENGPGKMRDGREVGLPADGPQRVAIMRSWFTNYLSATAPGAPPEVMQPGMAKRIPAGSKIVFQMHYTAVGSPQKDWSKIGLVFTAGENVKHELVTRNVIEQRFIIPPHDPDYVVNGTLRFREDTLLVEMFPHMHLRGKSFRYTAVYPDGREEILLDIPRYDFGWQNIYTLREPKLMPKGTVLQCVAHFDNSEENLSNPNPEQAVRFGDQTWDEMMIGFFNMCRVKEGPYRDLSRSRKDQFVTMVSKSEHVVTDEIRTRGVTALASDDAFDRWWDVACELLPQVDRIDVSVADGMSFRYLFVAQGEELPSTMKGLKELPKQISSLGPALGLYRYAKGGKTVVNNEPGKATGLEMKFMAKILPSSVHVPIQIDGKPCTVNFWSLDERGFPPEAVETCQKLVETLKPVTVQANAGK